MIQAKEIRIGNVLRYGAIFDKVSSISEDEGDYKISCKGLAEGWITDFEPIALTAEILEKNGFELHGDEWQVQIDGHTECYEFNDDGIYYTGGEGVQLSRTIKFVHDLQNLHFALTGTELEVTL